MAKMVQNAAILAKIQVQYKSIRDNFIMDSIFYQKVQLWPFLRMRNGKLGKKAEAKTWCICGKFTSNRE